MIKNLPNILTISRILIIPFVLVAMFYNTQASNNLASILFLYACITDYLDGWLARLYSAHSPFGKFSDPIADKLLVVSVIVMLVYFRKAHLLPAIAIIFREILVSGLREFLAQIRVSVPVSNLSKIKTFIQMFGILILIYSNNEPLFYKLGNFTLWCAALLTLFTGYIYLKESFKYFSN